MRRQLSAFVLMFIFAVSVLAQDEERITLGKLGQATEATKIYRTASTRSTVYYRVKPFEYLVINPYEKEGWLKVLLRNGKHGFIPEDVIARLPYNVTIPKKTQGTASVDAKTVLDMSYKYMGTPYKWGGNDLKSGIDCSGFVKELFAQIGVDLPRTAAEQYKVGKAVERIEDLKPGDRLYFWEEKRGLIGHTGIFMGFTAEGGAFFIHSSKGNKGVATDDLREPKWRKLLVAARR